MILTVDPNFQRDIQVVGCFMIGDHTSKFNGDNKPISLGAAIVRILMTGRMEYRKSFEDCSSGNISCGGVS